MPREYDYDAVIIGAGIGGLVCGCYLAKAGMKVLIVEKNAKPGGYCTSFTRGGYRFDACVHFLGSLRSDGPLKKIMRDLELEDKIQIARHDPSDIIISKDYTYSFWHKIDRTIDELSEHFPRERNAVRRFFNYISRIEGPDFLKLRNLTLQHILDQYFINDHLKSLLGFPILGNAGLPPSRVSAIRALTLYKELMVDGGYYFPRGAGTLPETLAREFKKYQGEINLNSPAARILIQDNVACGVVTRQSGLIRARYVISNADARHTFFDLIGRVDVPGSLITTLNKLEPSLSMFALYLGVKGEIPGLPPHANVWYLSNYDLERLYRYVRSSTLKDIKYFFVYYNPEERTILCFLNAPYISKNYWKENKARITDLLVEKIERVAPDAAKAICYKDAATPDTLCRWTSNFNGAAYGWAGTPEQFSIDGLSQSTPIKNLFLAGHWTTELQGVPGVAYLGWDTANMIIKKLFKGRRV